MRNGMWDDNKALAWRMGVSPQRTAQTGAFDNRNGSECAEEQRQKTSSVTASQDQTTETPHEVSSCGMASPLIRSRGRL